MAKKTDSYITHNLHYIDYCLQQLKKDIVGNEDAVGSIIEHLLYQKPLTIFLSSNGTTACNDLIQLLSKWDILQHGDIAGYIYQQLKNTHDKKRKGQYFTPSDIVHYITESALRYHEDLFNITILDPACGSGQFLIHAFNVLLRIYMQLGLDISQATHHICTHTLYGYDIDPIACSIARWNLRKLSGLDCNIFNRDMLLIEDLFHTNSTPASYDIIIGNPPWGAHFTPEQKHYLKQHYHSAKSGINSFTLFIERSLSLLNESGILSFLIPEAYLNIKAHQNSRQLVLSECCIKEIVLWGDCFKGVYAPSVSVTLQKNSDQKMRDTNIVNVKQSQSLSTVYHMIPQHTYSISHESIFSINYSRKAVALLEHIQTLNYYTLKGCAKFFLGVVTGNNQQFITTPKDANHPDPIIIGKDVEKYRINFSNHYFKFNVETLQQVADQQCYLTKNKIIYKFIGKRLTFAVEPYGYYTLNNVNGLIPLSDEIDPDVLVAILNSRLLQYIYETQFFTVKVLRGNLETLPIKVINHSNKKLLKLLSQSLRDGAHSKEFMNIQETIDDIIFHEYNIPDKRAYEIAQSVQHQGFVAS